MTRDILTYSSSGKPDAPQRGLRPGGDPNPLQLACNAKFDFWLAPKFFVDNELPLWSPRKVTLGPVLFVR